MAGVALPGTVRRSPVANAAAARTLTVAVVDAAGRIGGVDVELLSPAAARFLAAELKQPVVALGRFHDRLVERGGQD